MRASSAATKPEEMKRRATASPIPGPAPTTAMTGLFCGLWDMVVCDGKVMRVEMGQYSPMYQKSTSEKPNQLIIMRVWLYLISMDKRDMEVNGVVA